MRRPASGGRRIQGATQALALAHFQLLLAGVLGAQLFHQRIDVLLVGLIPVGNDVELLAIPLDDASPVVAHVIAATGLDRPHQLGEAQLFQTRISDVQVLEAPPNLLGRHVLAFAVLFLRGADGLYLQHGDHHSARVRNGADILAVGVGALPLVVHMLLQVFVHPAVVGAVVDGDAVIALGHFAQILDVVFRACPPDAVHLVAWIAYRLSLAYGRRRHDAGAPQQDEIRTFLADLQPGGFLLHSWRRYRIQLQFEAVGLGPRFKQGDRFLAVGRVVIDQGDLLAFQLVFPAYLLGNVLDHDVGCGPVGAQQREVPFEDRAVGRLRQAIAHGFNGHAVDNGLVCQRKRNTGGLRIEARRATVLVFQALVALYATVGRIGGFAFFVNDLHAVDAAIALIDQLEVVHLAIGPRYAQGRKRTGTVSQQWYELLVSSGGRYRNRSQCAGNGQHRCGIF